MLNRSADHRWLLPPPYSLLPIPFLLVAVPAFAQRQPVLPQISIPHSYYYSEMYLPQVTSGPSSVTWSPDGQEAK